MRGRFLEDDALYYTEVRAGQPLPLAHNNRLRLVRAGVKCRVAVDIHRSRPAGKIIRIGSDPLVQRMREADVLPTYRTRLADAASWYDTMGWDCAEPDSIRRILSELETVFSMNTMPKE